MKFSTNQKSNSSKSSTWINFIKFIGHQTNVYIWTSWTSSCFRVKRSFISFPIYILCSMFMIKKRERQMMGREIEQLFQLIFERDKFLIYFNAITKKRREKLFHCSSIVYFFPLHNTILCFLSLISSTHWYNSNDDFFYFFFS